MKLALGFAVAVAAVVASLASPAGATFPDDGKVIIKNVSGNTVNVGLAEDAFLYTLAPGKSFRVTAVNRFEQLSIDFDVDGDSIPDTNYGIALNGDKVGRYTIGDFGLYSIFTQE